MMEMISVVWKLVVFSFLLSAGSSDNNVCPKEDTTTYPVVHMCTDDVITQKNNFFIDVFVSATTATTCSCTLQTTTYVQINTSAVIAPDAPCDSEIRINTERVLKFQCDNGLDTVYTTTNFGPGDSSIQLRTEVSNKDATYCINIVKSAGTGHLSLTCVSPHTTTSATTTPTQTTTPTSTLKSTPSSTTASTPTSIPTSTPKSSPTPTSKFTASQSTVESSKIHSDSSTSDATQTRTTTPVITGSERQQGSASNSFPVAAAAGGAAGGVLIVFVVIVVIIFLKRRRHNTKYEDGDYASIDPDPAPTDNTNDSQQNQNSTNSCDYSSDPYSYLDDEPACLPANSKTSKPKVALKPNLPSSKGQSVTAESKPDEISDMYAKVNKTKPAKTEKNANEVIPTPGDVYAVVDKSKKNRAKRETKIEGNDNEAVPQPSDVYAVVDKSNKNQVVKTETPGDVYAVVDKSKKKEVVKTETPGDVYAVVQKKKSSAPKPPPGTPGLVYSDLAFGEDEDENQVEGAVGGADNGGFVSTNEDSVTYSTVSGP